LSCTEKFSNGPWGPGLRPRAALAAANAGPRSTRSVRRPRSAQENLAPRTKDARSKRLVLAASGAPHGDALSALLDLAADDFARAARGSEGVEGMLAFIQKRNAAWNDQ
jgi:hypothetical protein